jgi:nitrilase
MSSTEDQSRNLAQAHDLLNEACDRGAQLVAFPEYFSLMTLDPKILAKNEDTLKSGVALESIIEWAVEYGVWILAGSIPTRSKSQPKKVTNTSFLINSDGKIVAHYDKVHLFKNELKVTTPGQKVVVANTPFAPMGLSICYDLRFPEHYRECIDQGAALLAIPSAFTQETGQAHWDVLTRARAIENQSYVIAPAQWGDHPDGRKSYGHTRIIDPWGKILAERPAGTGVVIAELDSQEIERVRRELPALKDRALH